MLKLRIISGEELIATRDPVVTLLASNRCRIYCLFGASIYSSPAGAMRVVVVLLVASLASVTIVTFLSLPPLFFSV